MYIYIYTNIYIYIYIYIYFFPPQDKMGHINEGQISSWKKIVLISSSRN